MRRERALGGLGEACLDGLNDTFGFEGVGWCSRVNHGINLEQIN